MRPVILFFIFLLLHAGTLSAQKFVSRWQNVYGGSGRDVLAGIQSTKDGGFIMSGYSNSDAFGTKEQNANNKSNDYWVIKINSQGVVQWSKTIGGNGDDQNSCVLVTKDGGYLLGGISVSNISVNKTTDSRDSSYDLWLVKLDSSGNVRWDKTIGGIAAESMRSLAEGNNYYMAAGSAFSDSGYEKKQNNFAAVSSADYWIIKLNTSGQILSSQIYGGSGQDQQSGFQICSDSGFYIAGFSYSSAAKNEKGKKTMASFGNNDYYVVKSDASGNQLWDAQYGGDLSDYLSDVKLTSDSGFILGGYSNSPVSDNKTAPFYGCTDYWMVKTDKAGTIKWDKSYGGAKSDYLLSVQQTSDKGYLLGGYSNSAAGNTKSEDSKGGYDYWIVKTDSLGTVQWNKTIGGSGNDTLAVALEVSPGEYLVGGTSASPKSGDKTKAPIGAKGFSDYWLVRFGVTDPATKEIDEKSPGIASSQSLANIHTEVLTRLQVMLSPNPASGRLTVSYTNGEKKNNELILLSSDGKPLQRYISQNTSNTLRVDLSALPAGIYYISLSAGNRTAIRKFVKN